MNKTQAQTVEVDVGRCIFNPERKSLIIGGKEYELDSKDYGIQRNMVIKYADADTDIVSTKAELEEEIPTFTQATAMMEEEG